MAGEDHVYLAYIRSQPCCVCNYRAPSEAHHHTKARGRGQRGHDRETMPLCKVCHTAFHAASGPFKILRKSERREWQDVQVARYQQGYPGASVADDEPPVDEDVF